MGSVGLVDQSFRLSGRFVCFGSFFVFSWVVEGPGFLLGIVWPELGFKNQLKRVNGKRIFVVFHSKQKSDIINMFFPHEGTGLIFHGRMSEVRV